MHTALKLKFVVSLVFLSTHYLAIYSFAQVVPPQYIDSDGAFVVTCPGLPGTNKPPELLESSIGVLFNKPRIIKNPRVPESCYTNQYLECGDVGTSFMCDRNS